MTETATAAVVSDLEREVRAALTRRMQRARQPDEPAADDEAVSAILRAVGAELDLAGAECRALKDIVTAGLLATGHKPATAEDGSGACGCGEPLRDDSSAAFTAHALAVVAEAMRLHAEREPGAGQQQEPAGEPATGEHKPRPARRGAKAPVP